MGFSLTLDCMELSHIEFHMQMAKAHSHRSLRRVLTAMGIAREQQGELRIERFRNVKENGVPLIESLTDIRNRMIVHHGIWQSSTIPLKTVRHVVLALFYDPCFLKLALDGSCDCGSDGIVVLHGAHGSQEIVELSGQVRLVWGNCGCVFDLRHGYLDF